MAGLDAWTAGNRALVAARYSDSTYLERFVSGMVASRMAATAVSSAATATNTAKTLRADAIAAQELYPR
ncbi:hypothetical protein DQ04_24591000 [Trypanosoma grayi]|uniref:hypothetical protein n=1 Tax=Trypanosoma grayi TaxID=71804 RepID=UPI0004F45D73|nr:hypothetical protein DQ04_24591000 [Trypanosoma grayi]KEG05253.1 hypothetical protein DQ04_24591000 [Trypanosoma grayi]